MPETLERRRERRGRRHNAAWNKVDSGLLLFCLWQGRFMSVSTHVSASSHRSPPREQTHPKKTISTTARPKKTGPKACFAADGEDLRAAVGLYLRFEGGSEHQRRHNHDNHIDEEQQRDQLHSIKATYGEKMTDWCVDFVQDFSFLFQNQELFNEDISSWNVKGATTMEGMFLGASSFQQNLCSWKSKLHVKGVSMRNMFEKSGCSITADPQIENNQIVGPFCGRCVDEDDMNHSPAAAILPGEDSKPMEEAEKLAEFPAVSRPAVTMNEENGLYDENNHTLVKPSVHTHEAAAPGVQLVLLMLVVVFSLNGLLFSIQCKRSAAVQTGPYARLDATNPADDAESELEMA